MHLISKNGCSSFRIKISGSEISKITREIGEYSKETKLQLLEARRVECRQPIGEYSGIRFLILKVADRYLKINDKEGFEGYLIQVYKRIGLWYKRKVNRVKFYKSVNESIEGFKGTIMGVKVMYECTGYSFCVSLVLIDR